MPHPKNISLFLQNSSHSGQVQVEGSRSFLPSGTEDVYLQRYVMLLCFMVTVERDLEASISSRKMLLLKEGGSGWVEWDPRSGAITVHEPLLG